MKRLVVLISNVGKGSNLAAIITAQRSKKLNMELVAVISDTAKAPGLIHAQKNKIQIVICPHKNQLLKILKKLKPDFIALAGWKQIIIDEVIENYPNRILNVHPGLVPDSLNSTVFAPDNSRALWNRGMLTEKAIKNFIDNKATYAGSSIHFLTKQFDYGPVLERTFEKIKKNDSVGSLYKRLKEKEHVIYIKALENLADKPGSIIIIVDGGGRGSALVEAYQKSQKVKKIIAIPGNDFIKHYQSTETYPNVKTTDVEKIVNIAKKEKADLIDVAQDDAIASGLVDNLKKNNIKVFGPTKSAGQIEWDKAWSRNLMRKLKLPTPKYIVFNSEKSGFDFIEKQKDSKWFIKASGLAAGKGAIFAKNNQEAKRAIAQMKKFGHSGKTFLIEECIEGEEFSAFAVVNNKNFRILGYAQDHKRAFNKDLGPNTGGMGCSSPPKVVTTKIKEQVKDIFKKTTEGLTRLKRPYTGILYFGGMIDKNGKVWTIEFNARWGDPEAQTILPGIKNDYLEFIYSVIRGSIPKVHKDNKFRIVVAAASKGYPNDYSKVNGKEIIGFQSLTKKAKLYGAGIRKKNNKWIASGGRLFYVLGEGSNVAQARKMAYNDLSKIKIGHGDLQYRTDIGYRDLNRL